MPTSRNLTVRCSCGARMDVLRVSAAVVEVDKNREGADLEIIACHFERRDRGETGKVPSFLQLGAVDGKGTPLVVYIDWEGFDKFQEVELGQATLFLKILEGQGLLAGVPVPPSIRVGGEGEVPHSLD